MRHCGNLTPMWAISRVQAFQTCEAAVTIHSYMWESADISWALISNINKSYEMRKSNDGQEKLNLFLTQEIFLHGFEREWGASLASSSSRQNRLTLDARSGVVHQIQSIVQLDSSFSGLARLAWLPQRKFPVDESRRRWMDKRRNDGALALKSYGFHCPSLKK